jgi:antitoxin CptB
LIIKELSKFELEVLRKKLRWRSRRSLLELDLILQKFVDSDSFNFLDSRDLLTYQQMLEFEDGYLLSLFLNQQSAENELVQSVVDVILKERNIM